MTTPEGDRVELVLAAADGSLDDVQRRQLEALRAVDPTVDAEIAELRSTLEAVQQLDEWDEDVMLLTPSPAVLRGAKEQIASEEDATAQPGVADEPQVRPGDADRARPGRRALFGLAAAGLVATGAVGQGVVRRLRPGTPEGDPGTLGALERTVLEDVAPGAEIDLGVIAHTWGTETVWVVEGAEPGVVYDVVLLDRSGGRTGSGSFLGTRDPLDCELNAAILREDVAEVLVVTAGGQVWARAPLPPVGA
ncbi:hypothetical protein [uncultured Serinicoccus sp.]|uniref:hypothetical protein n=1 Tax=uncultured Serinicoccus sp. TaxID=735514 RepID=UPI0026117C10|nr:hypothetical protein [uncultured Serinicoccus sp.]